MIEEIRASHLRWINITNAKNINGPEIKFLKKNFNFHPLNLQDAVATGQRPKMDLYRDHFFVVLLYPLYNRKTGEIESAEIDFFVSRDYLISIHDNKLDCIVRFFNHLKKPKHQQEKEEFLSNNVIIVFYELLNKLVSHCLPMLDHISLDIHEAEKNIFQGKEQEMTKSILISRRNIVSFRKTMQTHKNVLKKLEQANRTLKLFDSAKADVYFNNLIDKTKDMWDSLESFRESIEALRDTNESLLSFRLNQIMKTFTTISVVIFILTLVATLFGMNAGGTPFVRWPIGFWIIVIVEVIVAFLIVNFFKRRKWLE